MQSTGLKQVQEGQYTQVIYTLIKDQKYSEAIQLLNAELQNNPKSRAAFSLLGYCYYHSQDFQNAAQIYEKLSKLFPEVREYKMYYAQSLYKSSNYDDALKVTQSIENTGQNTKILQLQLAIVYEQDQIQSAKSLLNQLPSNNMEAVIGAGCILYKEGKYEEARAKFQEAINSYGYQEDVAYSIALCYYKTKQLAQSLKFIADIIEKGVQEHPELGVGSNAEGIEVKSVGNTTVLNETALIEAFNLKAAIEYSMKNVDAAKEALLDMPPRKEEELDPVTLHNKALLNMEQNTNQGFKKLNFLIQNPPFPPETFSNLLMLYCKHQCFDLAADVLAENSDLTFKCISQDEFEYVDALILQSTSKEEAFKKLQVLSDRYIDGLRLMTKKIQDARISKDPDTIKKSLKEYDDTLEKYIPILMAQAKIYWDMENYEMVGKVLIQSAEYCSEHEVWKINMAHVFFMQENKYVDSIKYYEPIVKAHEDNLLSISAIVLANLCVSYIMSSKNQEAEKLMKILEKEEEKIMMEDPDKPLYHLCIVNLVIGTLYCSKGNFEFGISRII
jgi:tetratricopeptide repeat protein 30